MSYRDSDFDGYASYLVNFRTETNTVWWQILQNVEDEKN